MLTTDMDAAIERAVALHEYFLPEQDDILKVTAFRFIYIHLDLFTFNQASGQGLVQSNQIRSLSLHILQA